MMVRFQRHSETINRNQGQLSITSKNISSPWLIGNWFQKDYGMEERELGGYDRFINYVVLSLNGIKIHQVRR